jgi:hypothetical protein
MVTARRNPKDALNDLKGKTDSPKHTNQVHTKYDLANIQPEKYHTASGLKGLPDITLENLETHIPKVPTLKIADPLKPPEDAPRQTDSQREKTKIIYSEIVNANLTMGDAAKAVKTRFDAQSEQVKAFGSGVKLATEVEKVRGNVLDYHKTVEDNKQKFVGLVTSEYKTGIDVSKAVHQKVDLDAQLSEAENKALLSVSKAQKSREALENFRKQLGQKEN